MFHLHHLHHFQIFFEADCDQMLLLFSAWAALPTGLIWVSSSIQVSMSTSFLHIHTHSQQPHWHNYTHTHKHTHTYTHSHRRTIYVSFESGLLMERPPLISASFNDSLLKTGGRVIVCFHHLMLGKSEMMCRFMTAAHLEGRIIRHCNPRLEK